MNTIQPSVTVRRFFGAALLGGTLLLAGCGRNSLAGKWQNTKALPNGQSASSTIEFGPDGKETITNSAGSVSAVVSATYVVKDDNLQTTLTGITLNGQSFPIPPKLAAAQSVPFKVDGDTLTVTLPGQSTPVTMTRVKS